MNEWTASLPMDVEMLKAKWQGARNAVVTQTIPNTKWRTMSWMPSLVQNCYIGSSRDSYCTTMFVKWLKSMGTSLNWSRIATLLNCFSTCSLVLVHEILSNAPLWWFWFDSDFLAILKSLNGDLEIPPLVPLFQGPCSGIRVLGSRPGVQPARDLCQN